mgnify:CR=1 FL=1
MLVIETIDLMGYEEFTNYLDSVREDSFSITFEEIEGIIGEKLPDSALQYQAWWSNSDSHPFMREVLLKNWKSRKLNLEAKRIEFYKNSQSEFERLKQFCINQFPRSVRNYREIAIKILLQKENFTVNISEITDEIKNQNSEEEEPQAGYARGSKEMIDEQLIQRHKVVTNDGDVYSLLLRPENTTEEQIAELIEICDKSIGGLKQEYFLLRHNVDGTWQDDMGKKYHFGRNVPNQKKLRQAGAGTNTIWFTKRSGEFYFWGYGSVKEIATIQEDEEWNLIYDDFKYFDESDDSIEARGRFLKKGNESIKRQIESLPRYNQQTSMFKITKEIYEQITGTRSTMSNEQTEENPELVRLYKILERKKQIILYGPPGTGKTYSANELKKYILSKNSNVNSQDTTFSVDAENYFMINGPWAKNLGHSLDNPPFVWAINSSDPSNLGVYNKLQPNDIVFLSNQAKDSGPFGKKVILGVGKCVRKFEGEEPYWPDEIEQNKVIYKNRFEIELLHIVYDTSETIEFIQGLPYSKGFNAIVNENVLQKLLKLVREQWKGSVSTTKIFERSVTFHQSYSYEDFVEGIRPEVKDEKVTYKPVDGIFKEICDAAKDDPDNKYVLTIDEINRGNVEKILGELITLIESDKRKEEYQVILPYTKDSFWVPENLFIIGTMNTADRSIAPIDTALRRRFAFEELMPQYELEELGREINGISLKTLLQELNKRIRNEGISLRDKQIGHSYFMKVNNLEELRITFAVEIVPLLQDYFYNDYKKLEEDILNSDFIDSNEMMIKEEWQKDNQAFKTAINKILGQ